MKKIFSIILACICFVQVSSAQLRTPDAKEPGSNFWYGLTGKDSLSISKVWMASLVVPGYSQAYNRDYWKIPVVWGGIGGLIYGGIHNYNQYNKTGESHYKAQGNWFYIGAAAAYWASLLDGVVSYKTGKDIIPARATLYSTMFPGLGQIYNGDYWKLPILYGGLAFTCYLVDLNNTQYLRYRDAYNVLTDDDPDTVDEFGGRHSESNLKYYRDNARRNRDYAILFTVIVYALNIIDANVFAYLKDFDVSDNLAFRVSPAILRLDTYASKSVTYGNTAIGMQLQITF